MLICCTLCRGASQLAWQVHGRQRGRGCPNVQSCPRLYVNHSTRNTRSCLQLHSCWLAHHSLEREAAPPPPPLPLPPLPPRLPPPLLPLLWIRDFIQAWAAAEASALLTSSIWKQGGEGGRRGRGKGAGRGRAAGREGEWANCVVQGGRRRLCIPITRLGSAFWCSLRWELKIPGGSFPRSGQPAGCRHLPRCSAAPWSTAQGSAGEGKGRGKVVEGCTARRCCYGENCCSQVAANALLPASAAPGRRLTGSPAGRGGSRPAFRLPASWQLPPAPPAPPPAR